MQRYSLALVCLLALAAGAGAALALHYGGRGSTEGRDAAEVGTHTVRESGTGAEVAAGGVAVGALSLDRELVDSARRARDVSDEAADKAEDDKVVTAGKRVAVVGRRPETGGRTGRDPRPARVHVSAPRRDVARGGGGFPLNPVGGLKKTGKTIGNTFGKIGGVFHD